MHGLDNRNDAYAELRLNMDLINYHFLTSEVMVLCIYMLYESISLFLNFKYIVDLNNSTINMISI